MISNQRWGIISRLPGCPFIAIHQKTACQTVNCIIYVCSIWVSSPGQSGEN